MFAHLKSVIRRPVRMILLILLLGVVTFGFTARAVEYLVVTDAVDQLSAYYQSIGSLSSDDGDVTEGARLLADSDLIAINDVQRSCAGTLQGIYNADLDGKSSTRGYNIAEVLLWGELVDKEHVVPEPGSRVSQEYYTLQFHVVQRLYGYPDYAPEDGSITVRYVPDGSETDWSTTFDGLILNQVYGIRAYYSGDGNYTANLTLRRAVPDGEWFLPQDSPLMDQLVDADSVQEINRHRVTLNSTQDMSALPFTQQVNRDGYLIEGRWLNADDNAASNPVCVILQDFAEKRGLHVGDTLTITLSDEQMSYSYYPEGTVPEEMETSTVTTTFTIVGIFNRTIFSEGYTSASYRSLTVYIPDSCMPSGYNAAVTSFQDGEIYENGYSFVLTGPDAEEEFLRQYRSQLESMGYTVTMIENGWTEFSASARPICQSAAYSAGIFAIVQVMALLLVAFLYRRQHRQEFAIERALGIPVPKAIRGQLWPVVWMGAAGIGLGSASSWRYALRQAQNTLSVLTGEGQSIDTELPVWIPAAIWIISLALLIMLTLLGYIGLSHRPVIDLLHEPHKSHRRQPTPGMSGMSGMPLPTAAAPANIAQPHTEKSGQISSPAVVPTGHRVPGLVRFIRRQICRSKGPAALIFIVSTIFMLALGWIQQAILQTDQRIDEMYRNISVEAEILKSVSGSYTSEPGFIAGRTVDGIIATGFVQDSKLVAAMTDAGLTRITGRGPSIFDMTLCGINDTDVLNREMTAGMMVSGGDGQITYQDGWDETMFSQDYSDKAEWYPIVVSEGMLEQLGVSPGSQLILSVGSQAVTAVVKGSYTGQFNGLGNLNGEAVLMPLALMQQLYGNNLYYSVADFYLDPAFNRELDTFRTTAEQIVQNDTASLLSLNLVIWDEELRAVVQPMERNLTLMQVLYPIAQAVAFTAAAAVTLLLLLQQAKNAAILRVLGIPAGTVQLTLGTGQLILGLAGILTGLLVTAVSGKWGPELLLCSVIYLAGLTAGTAAGCIALTRKKPLELLQVKE